MHLSRSLVAVAALLGALLALSPPASASPVVLDGVDPFGRPFHLHHSRGRVVVVTFGSRYTQHEIEAVDDALRAHVRPSLQVVTVVDFVGIPGMFHFFARSRMRAATAGNPIQLLADEEGRWSSALAASPRHRVDILVYDASGELRGRFVGRAQVAQAAALAEHLASSSTAQAAR